MDKHLRRYCAFYDTQSCCGQDRLENSEHHVAFLLLVIYVANRQTDKTALQLQTVGKCVQLF